MFRKLVSNLPYSPGLLNTLSFYSHRLKRENVVRQLGIGFLVLAFVLQLLFWLVPPVSSVQAGTNDIIYGGIGDDYQEAKLRMIKYYRDDMDPAGRRGIQDLFTGLFGITEQDLLSSVAKSVDTQDTGLKSLGRLAYNKPGEVAVKTPAGATYYLRPIGVWPWINRYQPALYIPSKDIYILYDCGNIVTRKYPTPNINISKIAKPSTSTKVKPGDKITYSITYRNTGSGSAGNAIIKDYVPTGTFRPASQKESNPYLAPQGGPVGTGTSAYYYWKRSTILPGAKETLLITFTVKSTGLKNGSLICNRVTIEFTGGRDEAKICHTVEIPSTPPPPEEAAPPPEQPPEETPELFKRAENISAPDGDLRRQDANQTVANAGEKIRYILSIVNNGKVEVKDFQFPAENIADILDYVDEETGLIDLGGAEFNATTKELTWKPATIKAGETIEHAFTVQVKNPIPTSPTPPGDPAKFDLTMTNVYGNVIEINVPLPPEKIIERTGTTLPNTGPGTTLAISLLCVGLATFLRSRNRLIIRELQLVKEQQLSS